MPRIYFYDEKQAGVEEGLRQGPDLSGVMMMMRVVAGNCGQHSADLTVTHTIRAVYSHTSHLTPHIEQSINNILIVRQ